MLLKIINVPVAPPVATYDAIKKAFMKISICALNNRPCIARIISDPEGRSSDFFGRGRCGINKDLLSNCPAYGISKESFLIIAKEKSEKELNEKLKIITG